MKIAIIAILTLVLILLLAGYIAFSIACWRRVGKIMGSGAPSLLPYKEQMDAGRDWFLSQQPEKVEILPRRA